MSVPNHPLLQLTAGELMNREVRTLSARLPIKEAAQELAHWGLRGMPVVEEDGRLVGMLSVADLARWLAQWNQQSGGRACAFQHVERLPGGQEHIHCLLPAGACPFQRLHVRPDGQQVLLCGDPYSVPTDWQLLENDSQPALVRDVMTTVIHCVPPHTPVAELARRMLDHGVHRLLVTDPADRLLGIVSADDLLQVLARLDDDRFQLSDPTPPATSNPMSSIN
ncbi:MAG: CBS domain-containing protein [Gemmataceae bacterium]|nr:CBS domain-containing protein [Gemmataceae bacterium]MCS7269899.1 CBS domain-containing protein [Gemmataceae bacterium]MDW8243845.1 CBS domain-containing protein [Thermogemmata sp.]